MTSCSVSLTLVRLHRVVRARALLAGDDDGIFEALLDLFLRQIVMKLQMAVELDGGIISIARRAAIPSSNHFLTFNSHIRRVKTFFKATEKFAPREIARNEDEYTLRPISKRAFYATIRGSAEKENFRFKYQKARYAFNG